MPVRVRRRPTGRARVHSSVEWFFLGFVVLGFPAMIWLFGPAAGMFAYVAIGFMLLALTNHVDTWASERFWTPGNERAALRKRHQSRDGAGW